ncbi:serine hydrolase [Haloarculaceae archaeon H-GB1-1]|nr:serine hydrolase [Haloarculaceae archaeon H-GB1-1]
MAGVLAGGGWLRRTQYLHGDRDRTSLGGQQQTQPRVTGPNAQRVPSNRYQTELDAFSARRNHTGLQASIRFGDGTGWHGVAGHADHDRQRPLGAAHHLYIGSVTKLFTATLVLRHVQRDVLSLSDPIDNWIDLDEADGITVRMLLNHTSGIPNYTENPWFIARYFGRPTKHWAPTELVNIIRRDDLRFQPGMRHEYSNSNYILLGVILERATETAYCDLIRQLIRDELGYDDTYYLGYPATVPIANAYDESIFKIGRRNLTGFRTSLETGAYAAGGILSTAPDVAGVVNDLFNGRILDEATLDAMRTFVDAPDEDVTTQEEYGLGLRHLRIDGKDLYGHTGTIPGYSVIAMHHDDPEYTIAVLSNVSTIDQAGIYGALQRITLEEYY